MRKEKIRLTIDGKEIITYKGKTILEVALENNIYIPYLCYHPELSTWGGCRICIVEIKEKGIFPACEIKVEDNIKVETDNPKINKMRKNILSFIFLSHPTDCIRCSKNGECKLQEVSNFIGFNGNYITLSTYKDNDKKVDTSNPFFNYEPNKCIICGICVRTCNEISLIDAIGFLNKGYKTEISPLPSKPFINSTCVSCGECVVRCPVGALYPKVFEKPSREVKSICPYCGCGCGIYLGVRGNKIVSVRGDKENPSNKGVLCVKGRFGFEFINNPERLKKPLLKKNGRFYEISWEEAFKFITEKLKKYKGNKFAFLASAKCTNEENYIMQKFVRVCMETNNIDHCARLCHAPSVSGLVKTFGSGAMTNSIGEIKDAKCIIAIGTNTTYAHPIIGIEIRKAVRKGAILIVINPKEIDLCRDAHLFLKHYPGSDVALLMGIMKIIIEKGLEDKEFIKNRCENFEKFKKSLEKFNLEFVEKVTGVEKERIIETALIIGKSKPCAIFYAMGITQHSHGTDNVFAISNLALLTGSVGKKSTGVNPLRGQNNVQGACDMGALPNVFPGYQSVEDPDIRKKFEKAWGYKLPDKKGLTHVEFTDAIYKGEIKCLYIAGENPLVSEADVNFVIESFKKLELLIVQDIFLTETAKMAHIVLPAASFAEKDGTFTNTERRVQRIYKAIEPPSEAKPDWEIICKIAQKMGYKGFDFKHPSEIMEEIRKLTPIYGGITYKKLSQKGIQWPCKSEKDRGTKYLHKEKFARPNGKGYFVPLTYRKPKELPDKIYPFILTTDRDLYHYHTTTMTGRVKGLKRIRGEEFLLINPEDAQKLNIKDGEYVVVESRRGRVRVKVKISEICKKGVVSLTFHFPEVRTNVLTNPALDPFAKIPETKVSAVRISKIQ